MTGLERCAPSLPQSIPSFSPPSAGGNNAETLPPPPAGPPARPRLASRGQLPVADQNAVGERAPGKQAPELGWNTGGRCHRRVGLLQEIQN